LVLPLSGKVVSRCPDIIPVGSVPVNTIEAKNAPRRGVFCFRSQFRPGRNYRVLVQ